MVEDWVKASRMHFLAAQPEPTLPEEGTAYISSVLDPAPHSTSFVIDNGSSTLRAGYSHAPAPQIALESSVSKYRDRKANRVVMYAGSELYSDTNAKAHIKKPYEDGYVFDFAAFEQLLDFVFLKAGMADTAVNHPLVMSERICNSAWSRSQTTELLFECYGAPSVTYAVDSLASFSANNQTDGLVVSSSTTSTTIVPVLDGKPYLANSRRLNWGGQSASDYLLKLVQLKYPFFPTRVTPFQATALYQEHCYFSSDYNEDLRAHSTPASLLEIDRIVQFPFVAPIVEEKTEEELAKIAERKREAGRRLQEQAAKSRLEKLVQKEEDLAKFNELKAWKTKEKKADWNKRIAAAGFPKESDLDALCVKLEAQIKKARNKELGIDEEELKEPPAFPLVDVPDHQLNEEDLKKKRLQRLLKAGYDARLRAKQEKEAERARLAEEERLDSEKRQNDPSTWIREQRQSHNELLEKAAERKKRKAALTDRKSLAAQQRMKSIATLAADAPTKKKRKKDKEDTFGANDADWMVYREIVNEESDASEDEAQAISEVENRLLTHDPNFTMEDTMAGREARKHYLLNSFIRGIAPTDPIGSYDPQNPETAAQLHLNVERIKVPEVLYQPEMGGLDSAGLGELIMTVLGSFDAQRRNRLVSNVFLTGGNTLIPLFDARLQSTMRSLLPVNVPLTVNRAKDPLNDAWRGMAKLSQQKDYVKNYGITREDYNEKGAEWYKEHRLVGFNKPF